MGDEFQVGSGSGNWWDSSRPSASTALNSTGSFGWPTEMVDIKARSSMDSLTVSGSSSMVFSDSHKQQLQGHESSSGGAMLADPNLQLMGLGLSSQAMDWNQPALFRDEKAESSSFSTKLQEGMRSNANFQQDSGVTSSQDQWRQKIYTASSDDSSVNDYKQINRGFSLDHQQQYASHIGSNETTVTCQGLATSSFQMDSASAYGNNPTILQGLLTSDNHPQQSNFDTRSMNYSYPSSYAVNAGELMPNWSKFPQFLRGSPPKQPPAPPPHGQLHFANSTPFWNATAAAMNDVRSSFFPSLQTQLPTPTFDDKPKNASEAREISTAAVKKTSGEASSKRPRNETPSALPAFKVRKEKMGDRITALQQLVSPFGKTDTASVLSEAIEYIKFLHEQVNVLSNPYMKSGASIQHQQSSDKSKDPDQGPKQDLRSRGLCLVPVSSTFPVTHETTVDFWTPTFGGTFR